MRALTTNAKCQWEPSADGKYKIGYIIIFRQDSALGFTICGGKATQDGHIGAIVSHVVPGSIMNIVCKLRVGDEIVEFNGYDLRDKGNEEVCNIIESSKNSNTIRLVAVRLAGNEAPANSSL